MFPWTQETADDGIWSKKTNYWKSSVGPAASVERSGQLVQLKLFIWTDGVEGQGQYNEAYGKSWQMLDGFR